MQFMLDKAVVYRRYTPHVSSRPTYMLFAIDLKLRQINTKPTDRFSMGWLWNIRQVSVSVSMVSVSIGIGIGIDLVSVSVPVSTLWYRYR